MYKIIGFLHVTCICAYIYVYMYTHTHTYLHTFITQLYTHTYSYYLTKIRRNIRQFITVNVVGISQFVWINQT